MNDTSELASELLRDLIRLREKLVHIGFDLWRTDELIYRASKQLEEPGDTFAGLCRELVAFIRQKHSVPPSEPLTCPILRRMEEALRARV